MSVASIAFTQKPFPAVPADHREILQSVAKRCFIELAVSFAIQTIAIGFTVTPLQGTFLFAALAIQTICNATLRYADAMAAKEPPSEDTQWVRSACRYLCPTMFAYLTAVNIQSLIHESGHALTAACLFQNAQPEITITPSLGGLTSFSAEHLTQLGTALGREGSLFLTTLMGPVSTLLVSAVAILVGLAVEGRLPELGSYLLSVGRGDFYAHSFYALTACSSSPGTPGHDFTILKKYGIHPLAASALIFALPGLLAWGYQKSAEKDPIISSIGVGAENQIQPFESREAAKNDDLFL